MADLTAWIVAAFVLLGCFAATCAMAVRRGEAQSLAAAQTAGSVLVLLVVALSIWWDQSSLMTVALAAILLALPGALVMARLLSREIDR